MNNSQIKSSVLKKVKPQKKSLNSDHAKLLYETLHSYSQGMECLAAHLQNERDSIARRDHSGLQETLTKKEETLNQIAVTDNKLIKIFQYYGITKESEGALDLLLDSYNGPLSKPLKQVWNNTQIILKRCQTLNSINGKIVHHAQSHLAKLVSIIKGQDYLSKTYQKNGHADAEASTRSLAKA